MTLRAKKIYNQIGYLKQSTIGDFGPLQDIIGTLSFKKNSKDTFYFHKCKKLFEATKFSSLLMVYGNQ